MRRVPIVLGAGALVLVIALGVVARDRGGDSAPAWRVARLSTARVVSVATYSSSGAASQIKRGEGAYDFGAGRGEFTFAVPDLGAIPVVADGSFVYIRQPLRGADGQQFWTRFDRAPLAGTARASVGFVDPQRVFAYLNAAAVASRRLPDEAVGGVTLRHYRRTVRASTGTAAASTLPIDVWLDAEDRPRKVAYSFDLARVDRPADAAQQLTGSLAVMIEFSDFGAAVTFDGPPAPISEVIALRP